MMLLRRLGRTWNETLVGVPATAAGVEEKDTIKSLEEKQVDIRPGKVILGSSSLARDNYRAFLDLVSDDSELRAEAMRRLGDLELEATEADQLMENIDTLDHKGYNNAVGLYQQLLEAYPETKHLRSLTSWSASIRIHCSSTKYSFDAVKCCSCARITTTRRQPIRMS